MSQMENPSICIRTLINNITLYLSGNTCKTVSVVKINNDNLPANGELYFLPSLKVWNNVLQSGNTCDGKCATILQHSLHLQGSKINRETDINTANEVLQSLISSSSDWAIQIERYSLEKERICLFLHRVPLITSSIKAVIALKHDFGRILSNQAFNFEIHRDDESELTTARLRFIKSVTERILDLRGCKVCENSDFKFVFTTKSEGTTEGSYAKYVCGVVKNSKFNSKETVLTWEEYIRSKVNELKDLNQEKYFETECNAQMEDGFLKNVAQAMAKFELLSMKPSRPVFIGHYGSDKNITNTKGASFVLYNVARITAIIEKYNRKRSKGEYPDLPSIDKVNFSLLNQEEEWELIYNYVIGYQEMIRDCLKCEYNFQTNPQVICIFLSRLCQKFSIYYRRIRILTEADHLIPTMIARLYMLQALQILLQNTLALLDIVPVSRM